MTSQIIDKFTSDNPMLSKHKSHQQFHQFIHLHKAIAKVSLNLTNVEFMHKIGNLNNFFILLYFLLVIFFSVLKELEFLSFWYYYTEKQKKNRMIKFDKETLKFSMVISSKSPIEVPAGMLVNVDREFLTAEQFELMQANRETREGIFEDLENKSAFQSNFGYASSEQTVDSKASLDMANREWEINAILDHKESETVYEKKTQKKKTGKYEPILQFLVKWRSMGGAYEDEWLEEGYLCNSADMVNEYCKAKKLKFRLKPELYQLNGVCVKDIKTTETLYFSANQNAKNVKQRFMQDSYQQQPKNNL